ASWSCRGSRVRCGRMTVAGWRSGRSNCGLGRPGWRNCETGFELNCCPTRTSGLTKTDRAGFRDAGARRRRAARTATGVHLDWGWGKNRKFLDMVEIRVDRGNGWEMFAFDTTPGY